MGRLRNATVAVALLLLVGAPTPTLAAEPLTLSATLTSVGEDPPLVTSASGEAVVVINAERTELTYRITYRGLSSPLSFAAFCVTWDPTMNVCAPPMVPPGLQLGPSPLVGTRAISAAQLEVWLASPPPWVQLTTTQHSSGEIRGPLLATPATPRPTPTAGGSPGSGHEPDTATLNPGELSRVAPDLDTALFALGAVLGVSVVAVRLARRNTQRGRR